MQIELPDCYLVVAIRIPYNHVPILPNGGSDCTLKYLLWELLTCHGKCNEHNVILINHAHSV